MIGAVLQFMLLPGAQMIAAAIVFAFLALVAELRSSGGVW